MYQYGRTIVNRLGHGRIEDRECLVYRHLGTIRTAGEWKDLKSIIRIEIHKIDKRSGKKSDETRFYITSLTSDAKTLHGKTPACRGKGQMQPG